MVTRNDDVRIFRMPTKRVATVEDLYRFDGEGKAELVNGELVAVPPAGGLHGRATLKIAVSLYDYERRTKRGQALGDSVGFLVRLPNRTPLIYIDVPAFGVQYHPEAAPGPHDSRYLFEEFRDLIARDGDPS